MEEEITYVEQDGQLGKFTPVDKSEELALLHIQKTSKESFISEQQAELDIINNRISQLENQ